MKECTTFNINITTFKQNKISKSINKDKTNLAKVLWVRPMPFSW